MSSPPQSREKVFLSLAINGVKRAEYKVKAIDPTIFLKSSFIVFKTNFRVGQPLRIRVEVNGEKAVPETDFSNNILEKDLRPQSLRDGRRAFFQEITRPRPASAK